MRSDILVIVSARNEADCIEATVQALRQVFPQALLIVADDGSDDATAALAAGAGAQVVSGPSVGKGGNATRGARRALALGGADATYLLCDGDLGDSAGALVALTSAVTAGRADLAVGAFAQRVGGGFGLAVNFARYALRRRVGLELRAPISGQRALSGAALTSALPFADRFAMEIGMTIDVARAGLRIEEFELDLAHRATARDWRGFAHRARQLRDFVVVYARRK